MKIPGGFYNLIYKHFTNYLAITFFLDKGQEPPHEADLLKYIHNNSDDNAFIEFLIQNIHNVLYIDTFADDMKTAISIHLQNIKSETENQNDLKN